MNKTRLALHYTSVKERQERKRERAGEGGGWVEMDSIISLHATGQKSTRKGDRIGVLRDG